MKLYIKYSADIYSIYLKYISKEDIHVYSIDECFLDITHYLKLYKKTAAELAKMIIDDVYNKTGICATVGIGTNLFLAKVALDITAKHKDDHMGYLDEEIFKKEIWMHKPITDIWNIGRGIAKRLEKYNCYCLYDITKLDEKILYKEFGINALFLIDHAYGREPCTIKEIKEYRSKNTSISNGQILEEDYSYEEALLAVKEMVELLTLELTEKHLVTNVVYLYVGYSKDIIKPTGGRIKLDGYTSLYSKIKEAFINLYTKTTNKKHLIRKLNIGFGNVENEEYEAYDLLISQEELSKEKRIQETIVEIKRRYGKNAILKGMNLEEKATTRKRNKIIGGHNGE
jgi:DNA polymerase V